MVNGASVLYNLSNMSGSKPGHARRIAAHRAWATRRRKAALGLLSPTGWVSVPGQESADALRLRAARARQAGQLSPKPLQVSQRQGITVPFSVVP